MTTTRPKRRFRKHLARTVVWLLLFATATSLGACFVIEALPARPIELRWSFEGTAPHRYVYDLAFNDEGGFAYRQAGRLDVGRGPDGRLRLRQTLSTHDQMPLAGKSLFAASVGSGDDATFEEGVGGTFLTVMAMLPDYPVTMWDRWHRTVHARQSVPLKSLGFKDSDKSVEVTMSAAARGRVVELLEQDGRRIARLNFRIRLFQGKTTGKPREVLARAEFDLDAGRYRRIDLAMEGTANQNTFSMTLTLDATEVDLPEARKAFARACTLDDQGRPVEALVQYDRAVRLAPEVADYRLAYARALMVQGYYQESDCLAAGLSDYLNEDTVRRWALGLRFDNALALGRPERADTMLARLRTMGTPPAELALRRAQLAFYRGGRPVEVGQLYLDAAKLAPDRVEPKLGMATCLGQMGRHGEQVRMLRDLAAQHPDRPEVVLELARALQLDGTPQEAERLLADAVAKYPHHVGLHRDLVTLYRKTDRPRRAAELLNRIVYHIQVRRSGNDRARLHYELATCYRDLQQEALLRRELEKALEAIHPMSFGSLRGNLVRQTAELYLQSGQPLKAIEVLGPYSAMARSDTAARRLLARAQAGAGQLDRAVDSYRSLLEKDPAWVDGWVELGRLLGRRGRRQEALQVLGKALELDPDNDRAREMVDSLKG